MKRAFVISYLIILASAMLGCSGSSSVGTASNDKALRAQFESAAHFDINKVPQNQRAMVQGLIDRQKAGVAAEQAKANHH